MKLSKSFLIFSMLTLLLVSACGDGGGGGGAGGAGAGAGIVSLSVTDAKPMLPEGVTNVFVTFDEVLVHKSGGNWTSLPLVQTPYTIDLLQFQNQNMTELVPPTRLDFGKYTQVRIVVSSVTIRFDNGGFTEDKPAEVPSENLKTDNNFVFDVTESTAIDMVVHFDLSQSIVVSSTSGTPTYKLKPVLHLFDDPLKAATIEGNFADTAFCASDKITVIVIAESNQEEYTRVEVPTSNTTDPTVFRIFWLVPDKSYTVQIDFDQDDLIDWEELVDNFNVPEGEVFELNDGESIDPDSVICS